jgi:hypothetical protein
MGRPRLDPKERERRKKEAYASYYLEHADQINGRNKARYQRRKVGAWVIYYPAQVGIRCFAAGGGRPGGYQFASFSKARIYKSAGACRMFMSKHPGGFVCERKETEELTIEAVHQVIASLKRTKKTK